MKKYYIDRIRGFANEKLYLVLVVFGNFLVVGMFNMYKK